MNSNITTPVAQPHTNCSCEACTRLKTELDHSQPHSDLVRCQHCGQIHRAMETFVAGHYTLTCRSCGKIASYRIIARPVDQASPNGAQERLCISEPMIGTEE